MAVGLLRKPTLESDKGTNQPDQQWTLPCRGGRKIARGTMADGQRRRGKGGQFSQLFFCLFVFLACHVFFLSGSCIDFFPHLDLVLI